MVDLHRLRILCSVVAAGSLRAAADALQLTPSAVSQHLTALQRETGLTLLEKAGRGVAPTEHGRRLAERGEEALASMARVDRLVRDLRVGHSGSLSIGTFASASQHWLPTVVATLQREFPATNLIIELTDPPVARVRPDIDIRTERQNAPPYAPPGITRVQLARDPFVVILPRTHRLAGQAQIAAADLGEDPWLHEYVGDGEAARIVEDIWRAAGIAPGTIIQSADHHGTIAFVAAGVGVSVMPTLAATELPPSVVAVPLVRPDAERIIVAHVRSAVRQRPIVLRALELLKEKGAGGAADTGTGPLTGDLTA